MDRAYDPDVSPEPDGRRYVEAELAERVRQLAVESDRQRYVEAELAKRVRRRFQHYGSFVAATVTIGPVAVGFAIVQMVTGKPLTLGEVGYFLAAWAMVFIGFHSWAWVYYTWHRGRHRRR